MQPENAGLGTMEILLHLIDSTQYTFDGDCSLSSGTCCYTWQTRNKTITLFNDNTKTDRITVRDYRRDNATTLELMHTKQGIQQRRIEGTYQERQEAFKTREFQAVPPGGKADLIKQFLDDNLAFARISDAVLAHFIPLRPLRPLCKRDASPTRK
jgi:hypothetical protein